MNEWIRKYRPAAIPLAFVLAGCGGGSGGDSGADSSATDDGGTGTLTLGVTDAPVDGADAVNVVFTAIGLKPADGDAVTFACDEPAAEPLLDCGGTGSRTLDLLTLTGPVQVNLLEDVAIPAGRYDWIRLRVDAASPTPNSTGASTIEIGGATHVLAIPSGRQTGLKLVSGFVVPAGGSRSLTIDFDLRSAVTELPRPVEPRYLLRPALRLVDTARAGHLAGAVTAGFVGSECASGDATGGLAVYVFAGPGAPTGDLGDAANPPVTTAMAALDPATGDYPYEVGYLEAGAYTAAVTCEAGSDDPATDTALDFVATADVAIEAGRTTVQDFDVP